MKKLKKKEASCKMKKKMEIVKFITTSLEHPKLRKIE